MRIAPLLALMTLLPLRAGALTLDFDVDSDSNPIVHGQVIDNEYAADGVTISAINPNRSFDLAIAFDTTERWTPDPDLEDPWDGGNLASHTLLRNILIIAERDVTKGKAPDDEGNRPAGQITFDFASTMVSMGFDMVDLESTIEEPGGVDFMLSDGGGGFTLQGSFEFMDLVTSGTPVFDPTLSFGNNTANRIDPILLASLDNSVGPVFDRVVFRLGGSGGLDNLVLASAPEPSLMWLGLLSAAALAARRRG